MSERDAIEAVGEPNTRASIARDLRALGVRGGAVVIVHASLSALGWVAGGPVTLIEGLLDALGPDGTAVMPTFTAHLSDPGDWRKPPVPEAWWEPIRRELPPFDPARTPSRGMGAVAELFRTWPGAVRSYHPRDSFAALGPRAAEIVEGHSLDMPFGERSPLARIYALDGQILLLGVGHDRNTSFHLAEHRVPPIGETIEYAPILRDGRREWGSYHDIVTSNKPFARIGADLDATGATRVGAVGAGEARLVSQVAAVDHAVEWLTAERAGRPRESQPAQRS